MSVKDAVYLCWQQGREEGGEDVDWVWLCGGCVAPPVQERRLAVAWAVLYVECVCSVAMWDLCVGWVAGLQWPGDT